MREKRARGERRGKNGRMVVATDAKRCAAKGACSKALGTGISRGVGWKEIEVRRAAGERPTLHLSGRAAERAAAMSVKRLQLSLTHSRTLAMAFVAAED